MKNLHQLPRHNLGLYRLEDFVGRSRELQQLSTWLSYHPVVAITGPSGAGKSTLATKLAVQEASNFTEGILWISATGNTAFNFYDIVRGIEDVLATGITKQLVSAWPLFVLQQLYGFNRLLILDELTEADSDTVDKIIDMIGQIKPGGHGRFVLIGRTLPQPLLDIVGEACLVLDGLDQTAIRTWLENHRDIYAISPRHAPRLHRFTGGHPLVLKLVAGLWESSDLGQLFDLVSIYDQDDWEARLKGTVIAALATLERESPEAIKLLIRCSQASGGFEADAIKNVYWRNSWSDVSLIVILQKLLKHGVLLYNRQDNRYFIHPLIRRYLDAAGYANLTPEEQLSHAYAHAEYYLRLIQRYEQTLSQPWHAFDGEWGNIRKAFGFLVDQLENVLGLPVEQAIGIIDREDAFSIPLDFESTLALIKGYALALRAYIVSRHPPEGCQWLTAGIIASHYLIDSQAVALLGKRLAALAYAERDYLTAKIWYQNSLQFFRQINDRPRIVQLLRELGETLTAMQQLDEAMDIYTGALQMATVEGFISEQAIIQAQIGTVFYKRRNFEQAIIWYKKALAIDEAWGDEKGQAVRHNEIGLALEVNGDFEQAIAHYQKAADLYRKMNDKLGLSTVYGNLGAACYEFSQFQEALDWYERDLAVIDGLGHWFDLAAILHNMGHVALALGNSQAAINYFIRSRDIYLQFGQLELAEEDQRLIDAIQDRHAAHS